MLTSEDIKNLIEAQKEAFYTREEMDVKFDAMNQNFSSLQGSVDAYAKKPILIIKKWLPCATDSKE